MKYSDLLGEWLVELGYTHCFFVAGGGIMHLLDGFRNRFQCVPVVHEVTAGIAAEHFNECTTDDHKAFALVTTGPGLTNLVTAIAGCYVEHRELLVIAGQVKSTDLLTYPERQRGVQEVDGTSICNSITVQSECFRKPEPGDKFKNIVLSAQSPHPGPVLIEVCLDVQGAQVEPESLIEKVDKKTVENCITESELVSITELIKKANRPLILLGGLVERHIIWSHLESLETLGIPIVTTTSAIDRIPTNSKIFGGRPGIWGGQRAGNLVIAQSDVLLVIGAQLDLQQTGFNFLNYAPEAKLIHVFPSKVELNRVKSISNMRVNAAPGIAFKQIVSKLEWEDNDRWRDYVTKVRQLAPAIEPANKNDPKFIHSFSFYSALSKATDSSDILALCSSGGSFTGCLQSYDIKKNQFATTSAAHASMGYGLATAIGVSFAYPQRRVILTEGEGGFSQNLQELAIIQRHSLAIKIFLIDNSGYASIRATQKKFFGGAYLGCDPETGLGFPDWEKLFAAYSIPCRYLNLEESNEESLRTLMAQRPGPEAWIVKVDPEQPNWPAVSTRLSEDGSLTSSPLYDMRPELSPEVLKEIGKFLPESKS